MQYLNLSLLKKHLNVDDYFTDDDTYIMSIGDVAEQIVQSHLDDKLANIVSKNDGQLPAPIRHAMLLLAANMYANREGVAYGSVNDIPHTYEYLLSMFENFNNYKG